MENSGKMMANAMAGLNFSAKNSSDTNAGSMKANALAGLSFSEKSSSHSQNKSNR